MSVLVLVQSGYMLNVSFGFGCVNVSFGFDSGSCDLLNVRFGLGLGYMIC